jgi:hypothetical protein
MLGGNLKNPEHKAPEFVFIVSFASTAVKRDGGGLPSLFGGVNE